MKKYINIPYVKLLLIFFMGSLTVSCSKDDEPTVTYQTPGMAELVLPENNTECEVGDVIANMASVAFQWNQASDAERYDLVITNLATQEVKQRPNLDTTAISVRLERGNAYSWKVISKNRGEETTASDPYKFYVAGDASSNNVPLTATLLSPASGATVSPVDGKVSLEWESDSTDVDGDQLRFTLFLDKVDGEQEPPEDWKDLTATSIAVNVDPNSVYYWHVETS